VEGKSEECLGLNESHSLGIVQRRVSIADDLCLLLLLCSSSSVFRWLGLDLNLGCHRVFNLCLLSKVLILVVVVVEFPNSPVGSTIVFLLDREASRFISCPASSTVLVSFLIFTGLVL